MKSINVITTTAASILLLTNTAAADTLTQDFVPDITVTIDADGETIPISPYIYGVNDGTALTDLNLGSIRLGGNRMSAYNWETNVSNAGSDWYNSSDMHLTQSVRKELRLKPGAPALEVSAEAAENDIPYSLLTLQMMGYVADGAVGRLTEAQAAPSECWSSVVHRKGSEYTFTPDTTDGIVYTDEYLNYLFNEIGNSQSSTGFKGYALDNEPGLWSGTHSLAHGDKVTCAELIERTVELASVIKDMDSNADVFGPSLYGYYAYLTLQDAPDWNTLKSKNNYRWFIDYYLDELNKAEQKSGRRLVDVLDIHYYTEAKGECGERSCNHYDNDACIEARLNSIRSLWDEKYKEDSWITDSGAKFFPLLPNIQKSIGTYYPGTKLAFTEYNFGGGDHISGGVAQAEFLGTLAQNGVYFATLWNFDKNEYQLEAIRLFRNYDGCGSQFGDLLLPSTTSDDYRVNAFASLESTEGDGTVRVVLTNKSIHESTNVSIQLSSDSQYISAAVYELTETTGKVSPREEVITLENNMLNITLEPLSVTHLVIQRSAEQSTEQPETPSEQPEIPSEQPGKIKTSVPMIVGIVAGAVILIAAAVFEAIKFRHRKTGK